MPVPVKPPVIMLVFLIILSTSYNVSPACLALLTVCAILPAKPPAAKGAMLVPIALAIPIAGFTKNASHAAFNSADAPWPNAAARIAAIVALSSLVASDIKSPMESSHSFI